MQRWAFSALVPLLVALQAACLSVRASIPTPDQDPFYQPPDGWQDKPLGTVLRSRSVEIHGLTEVRLKEAYQLLYRTSYVTEDQPTTTVTTVMVPENAHKDKLVVYGDFEDANGPRCAPSYTYRVGASSDPSGTANMASTLPFLQQGYTVTVPDKEGNKGAFASGHVEGHQTLDGIRATLSFDKLGFGKDTKVVGSGYSGGAIQIGWAAAMKSTYAPELPISGWYMGGTPANLTSMILLLNKSLFSAFVLGGITGIVDTYPQASDLFDKVATKEGQKALSFARTNCLLDDLVTYPFQDVFSEKYSSLGEAFLTHPDVKPILNSLTMGYDKKYTPDAPILMVHGKADEISPYDSAKKSAQDWCNNGADVEFHTYDTDLSAHFITQITATAKSYVWLTDRLDGKPANSGCKFTSSQDVILDPNALGPGLQNILDILTGLAGDQIGPGDAVLAQKIRNGN